MSEEMKMIKEVLDLLNKQVNNLFTLYENHLRIYHGDEVKDEWRNKNVKISKATRFLRGWIVHVGIS